MKIIRNIISSLALYSRIPMPTLNYRDGDMDHAIAFLPFVGIIIGALEMLAGYIMKRAAMPDIARAAIYTAIPLLVTGGFHVDGFMDVQDAFKSYKSREEKLQILKDPHIGAFAVISLVTYACFWLAAMSTCAETFENAKGLIAFAAGFAVVRAVTAITSITFKRAKKSGMLHEETKSAGRVSVIIASVFLAIGLAATAFAGGKFLVAGIIAMLLFIAYYRWKCNKEFGGVTGDTAGYFVTMGELVWLVALAAATFI